MPKRKQQLLLRQCTAVHCPPGAPLQCDHRGKHELRKSCEYPCRNGFDFKQQEPWCGPCAVLPSKEAQA